jgi:predicted permease
MQAPVTKFHEDRRKVFVFRNRSFSIIFELLAANFGADRNLPATLICLSTLLSCLTLPLWIAFA